MTNKTQRQALHSVYLLQHVAREGSDDEDVKVVGIYSSAGKAKQAIGQLMKLVGFERYPDSFYVDRYELDQSKWAEGFTTKRSKSKTAIRTRKPRRQRALNA